MNGSVTLNNFLSKTVSDSAFRHVLCFKRDNHRGPAIICRKRINRGGVLRGIPVIYELYGDPNYLAILDELINRTETAKQSLRMEHEGLSCPKEPGRKKLK